jgi:hypothetical protein
MNELERMIAGLIIELQSKINPQEAKSQLLSLLHRGLISQARFEHILINEVEKGSKEKSRTRDREL